MSRRSAFECMFVPQSVAVVGATDREASVGRTLVKNLLNGLFHGEVYAVNPNREEVLGLHCYKDITSLPVRLKILN
jgi:acyl-CoA synthetase (NDP forming)